MKNRKRNRITISNMEEALSLLYGEEIEVNIKKVLEDSFLKDNIKFKVDDKEDFINYLEKSYQYSLCEEKLFEKLINLKLLTIERTEFDRDQSANRCDNYKEDERISKIDSLFYKEINNEEILRLEEIEDEIKREYILSKDIELLKKILTNNNEGYYEKYDEKKNLRVIKINIKDKIHSNYIKAEKGSVEYHNFINNNLSRLKRLLKSLDKYLVKKGDYYTINQSDAIQDSVNIALAFFNDKEFKAISGKNELVGYCSAPEEGRAVFKSCKVNKLGQMGYGYNRVNDSEKKILEEIHKEIEMLKLKDYGELILITRWQPCPSCYLVIEQFSKLHKDIKVVVKYTKKYGEI